MKKIFTMIHKIKYEITKLVLKDFIILDDIQRKVKKNQVNIHWFSSYRDNGKENLGDYLAVPINEYMLNTFDIDPEKKLSTTKHLYTVGSIIFFGYQNATIWGSGLLQQPKERFRNVKLDIRAVRGPETRNELLKLGFSCPEVYGDPAILLPLMYNPGEAKIKKKYAVILHKAAHNKVDNQIEILTDDWKGFVDKVCECELIISSSLHGIIIAESYGIPAILLVDRQRAEFSLFKYNDYYYSTGRYEYPRAETINEALQITPPPLPNMEKMRLNLMAAYPIDLWRE